MFDEAAGEVAADGRAAHAQDDHLVDVGIASRQIEVHDLLPGLAALLGKLLDARQHAFGVGFLV